MIIRRCLVLDWKMIFVTCCLSMMGFFATPEVVMAQTQPANPLEVNQKDPVIPDGYGKRSLTSFEEYRIEKTIAQLNQTAKRSLDQGNGDQAFKLWYRQLRLTRLISNEQEIIALGEIGAIAWEENRGVDVRYIAERLIAIQGEITAKKAKDQKILSLDMLNKLATAYQQVRYLDEAIDIYQQILANSRAKDDLIAEQKNLEILGQLYLARFDYPEAVDIYQELLALNPLANQESKQTKRNYFYLNTLIDLYDRTSQTSKAIAARKRLIEQYTAAQKSNNIPALKIKIAQDYETLKQPDKAIEAYNQAFNLAFEVQQLAIASDALISLSQIYQQSDRPNDAIATYTKLIEVQQQSYNYYGLINSYDTLGKIHLKLNQKAKAKEYFQQGLGLAKSVNYKVNYLSNQIDKID